MAKNPKIIYIDDQFRRPPYEVFFHKSVIDAATNGGKGVYHFRVRNTIYSPVIIAEDFVIGEEYSKVGK